jgi:hypothetical protein
VEHGGAKAQIQKAIRVLQRADGPVCLDCLGVPVKNEVGLLTEIGRETLPKYRVVESFCISCQKQKRVVRKIRSYP